ncbi:MAG: alpha/beta hydrolase, partial [Bacteriovoracia bacterium]
KNTPRTIFSSLLFLATLFSSGPASSAIATNGWMLEDLDYDARTLLVPAVKIRAGYLDAVITPSQPFRGNVLYLEGLGDSMLNHDSLFQALARSGYRVIAFDYMGQGGSTGTMNHTRVAHSITPNLHISTIAEIVWKKFRHPQSKENEPPVVIGWSTGGLAAYDMAARGWASQVILIAPGICPRTSVGEGFLHGNEITLRTLTSAHELYAAKALANPHVDPIRPRSPLLVPAFASNLVAAAKKLRTTPIPSTARGLVVIGADDRYVKPECTQEVLKKQAPHFKFIQLAGARHEIHNEVPAIDAVFRRAVSEFLNLNW